MAGRLGKWLESSGLWIFGGKMGGNMGGRCARVLIYFVYLARLIGTDMAENTDDMMHINNWDVKTFERVFKALYPGLCAVADRMLKDEALGKDMAQEAFVRLWERREEVKDIATVKAYLYKTVRNLCLNYLRDGQFREELLGELPDRSDEEFAETVIEEESVNALYAAIDRLPEQSERVMRLTLKGLGLQEIAEELAVSVNTVKTLKYNAIAALQKELGALVVMIFMWLEV